MNEDYNASYIKIMKYATDIWSMAASLSEKFNHDINLIERGLTACYLAGVPYRYYIDRYLRKLPIPQNLAVSTIYQEQQKLFKNNENSKICIR